MCIVKCAHLDVMFVTDHLPFNTIGSAIKPCILMSERVTVICVMCCSVTWRLLKNICSGVTNSIHILAVYVVKVSVFKLTSQYPTMCLLESVQISIMCVINALPRSLLWINYNVSILQSILTKVMCLVKNFIIRLLLMLIRSLILNSVHLVVVLVRNRLNAGIFLAALFPCAVWNVCSAVVCVNYQ